MFESDFNFNFIFIYFYIFYWDQFLYKLVKTKFNAEALINVEPKLPRILYQTDPSKYLHSYEDWLPNLKWSIITGYPLIEKAIGNMRVLGLNGQDQESLRNPQWIGLLQV